MDRRTLCFPDFDAVLADATSLAASGYDRAGGWCLAQICHHLAASMEMTLDGFPWRMPWPVRLASRWLFLGTILRRGVIRLRLPSPAYLLPPDSRDDRAALARLGSAVARLRGCSGSMQPSPAFGRLSPEEWRELHLWHCEHHLSFLRARAS